MKNLLPLISGICTAVAYYLLSTHYKLKGEDGFLTIIIIALSFIQYVIGRIRSKYN